MIDETPKGLLDIRCYSNEDIAILLKIEYNKHLSTKVKTMLDRYEYTFNHIKRKGYDIHSLPSIEYQFGLFIQVQLGLKLKSFEEMKGLATHIALLADDDHYMCMPWGTRCNYLKKAYNLTIPEKRLIYWQKILFSKTSIFLKQNSYTYWATRKIGDIKEQFTSDTPEHTDLIENWLTVRSKLLEEYPDSSYTSIIFGNKLYNAPSDHPFHNVIVYKVYDIYIYHHFTNYRNYCVYLGLFVIPVNLFIFFKRRIKKCIIYFQMVTMIFVRQIQCWTKILY